MKYDTQKRASFCKSNYLLSSLMIYQVQKTLVSFRLDHYQLASNLIGLNLKPTITDTIVNNNNSAPNNILNTLTSLNTNSRSSAEIPVVKSDLLKDNSSETNPSTFATLTPVVAMSSKAASAAAAAVSKASAKTLNIAEKMKKLNREEKLLSESSTNGDSLMSFNSASSNDEMVTSSDMNHPKPKK